MTDPQKALREYVAHRRRNVLVYLTSVGVLSTLLFVYIWQFVNVIEVETEILKVRRENGRLKEEMDLLLANQARLERLERIEEIAAGQLGMQTPTPDRIWYIEAPETGGEDE